MNVNYFSSIVSSQTFNTNIYDASRNQRTFGGNVVGAWANYSLNGTFDRSEYFYDANSSADHRQLAARRVSAQRAAARRIADLLFGRRRVRRPLRESTRTSGTTKADSSLARYDFNPQIRYPFKKWQWFTVNSTISWRDTYYTRSLNPANSTVVDEGVNRQFFEFQSQLLGPVFTRVWNTPDNGYAEKFKHSIEPYLNLDRTTGIDTFSRIVQLEGIDAIVGDSTRLTYGVNNRFYAKRRPKSDSPVRTAQAREIFDIELSQSYYTDRVPRTRPAVHDQLQRARAEPFLSAGAQRAHAADRPVQCAVHRGNRQPVSGAADGVGVGHLLADQRTCSARPGRGPSAR